MKGTIQGSFCPKCGKPTETAGLCPECRIGSTPWFTCDRRVASTTCPSCGAQKVVNTWTDSAASRSDLGPEIAKSAVHFHPEVKRQSIDVTINDITLNRSRAHLLLRGTLYKKPVEGTCTVEILWHREQCDRCNRISGSYHEGVVQVRAEGRVPSPYEVQTAASVAQQVEDTLQAGGERLSFIADVNETRDGLDIIIGSQHIGLLITQGIVARLGGRYTTHPKLVGEKNGRQLFRITYSVRLPRFQKNDVVATKSRYHEVQRVESRHLLVTDLTDGNARSVREEEVLRIIGNSRDAESGLVVFADGKSMGVLDPANSRTREYPQPAWLRVTAGDQIRLLRDGDELVFVR
jgi:nonsense-mediated mRNA decay protein 3